MPGSRGPRPNRADAVQPSAQARIDPDARALVLDKLGAARLELLAFGLDLLVQLGGLLRQAITEVIEHGTRRVRTHARTHTFLYLAMFCSIDDSRSAADERNSSYSLAMPATVPTVRQTDGARARTT